MTHSKHSIVGSSIVMFIISLILFWLPVVGPAIAGYVGGKRAGNISRALGAAVLPGIVLAGFLFLMFSTLGLPLLGIVAGLGLGVFIMLDEGALLAGAFIGGALAD